MPAWFAFRHTTNYHYFKRPNSNEGGETSDIVFWYSVVELMQSDWVGGSEGEREVEVEI